MKLPYLENTREIFHELVKDKDATKAVVDRAYDDLMEALGKTGKALKEELKYQLFSLHPTKHLKKSFKYGRMRELSVKRSAEINQIEREFVWPIHCLHNGSG